MIKCGNCKEPVAEGDTYITYGGVNWCALDCLAEYYAKNEIEVTQGKEAKIWDETETKIA